MDLDALWLGTASWLNNLPWWAVVLATVVVLRVLKFSKMQNYADFNVEYPNAIFRGTEQGFSIPSQEADGIYVITKTDAPAFSLLDEIGSDPDVHAQQLNLNNADVNQLKQLIQQGQIIEAVKFVRGLVQGVDLATAKRIVDTVKDSGKI